jgi:drug/metabolite transporter (DMT)-like permease
LFLALPWLALRVVECTRRRRTASALPSQPPAEPTPSAAAVECSWRQVLVFFALALGTNYTYIAALEFIPASLNTAVFSTSPVLTLALSVQFLDAVVLAPRAKWCSVALSIAGVAMICQPWTDLSPEQPFGGIPSASLDSPGGASRPIGSALSLAAAAGSASYQVYFKRLIIGHSLGPVASGVFLSRLGLLIFIFGGIIMGTLMQQGVYELDLPALPWALLAGSAGKSISPHTLPMVPVIACDVWIKLRPVFTYHDIQTHQHG